jgi:hypothetical protein
MTMEKHQEVLSESKKKWEPPKVKLLGTYETEGKINTINETTTSNIAGPS